MTTTPILNPIWDRRTALSVLTAFLLIVGITVGPGAPAANAYSMQYAGPVSWTRITGMYVVQSSLAYQPYRTLNAPVVNLGRTSAVPAGIAQGVTVETYVQRYSSGSWRNVGSTNVFRWLQPGVSNLQIVTGFLGRYPGGIYRAQVVVKWFDNYNRISGVRYYTPNVPADQVCGIATCQSKYGYVQFW